MTYDIRELPDCCIIILLVSASYGWKILIKGLERIWIETIVVCDVPQQIATSISSLVADSLCALSHHIVCDMSRTMMAEL